MARHRTNGSTPTSAFGGAADYWSLSPGGQHGAISSATDMRLLELLTARLCHELSGPVAAINTGAELLVEEGADPGSAAATSFLREAVALVSESARRAGSRLQFYRFAYGFGHSGAVAGQRPHELAIGFFDTNRIACDYAESTRALPLEWQKLACNLLAVGAEALPRGGRLVLADSPLNVEAVGETATLSPEAHAALTLATPLGRLTSRTVQAYFTGLLAKGLDCRLTSREEPGRVRLTAIAGGP